MESIIPGNLPAVWRERANTLRDFGDPNSARLWDIAAVELDRAMEVFGADTLSLVEAARESGFTADHLGTLVKRGKIPNAGRTGAPRIRRHDLPKKRSGGPGRPTRPQLIDPDHVRRIAHSFTERRR